MAKALSLEDTGVLITGQVTARQSRKFEKKGGGFRYRIDITLLTSNGPLTIERWCDIPRPSDAPPVGDIVPVPVRVQHYSSPKGSGMRFLWGPQQDSESF